MATPMRSMLAADKDTFVSISRVVAAWANGNWEHSKATHSRTWVVVQPLSSPNPWSNGAMLLWQVEQW